MEAPESPKDLSLGGPIRYMNWDDSRMYKVLFQCYGSVWPEVLPYCIANVLFTYGIWYLKVYDYIDLTLDSTGHKYMAALMSFLVVTRVKIIYDRYMQNSQCLTDLYISVRELAQMTCILTERDKSTRAKQWRHDVIYHAIVLLRVTMAILEFRSNPEENQPWDVPELSYALQADVKQCMFLDSDDIFNENELASSTNQKKKKKKKKTAVDAAAVIAKKTTTTTAGDYSDASKSPKLLAHSQLEHEVRTALDEATRSTKLIGFLVRQQIMKQRDGTWLKSGVWDHPCNEETRLLDYVGTFLKAFSHMRVLYTTPIPFPLVQMTKTFLFVWTFRVPFALLKDDYWIYNVCLIVFLITFGFFGLEFVAMELADVFGNDPSDFDNLGRAQLVFEDCYIAVYKCDGEAWARKLRHSVMGRQKELDKESEEILREIRMEGRKLEAELAATKAASAFSSDDATTSASSDAGNTAGSGKSGNSSSGGGGGGGGGVLKRISKKVGAGFKGKSHDKKK